ncbi:MAG: lysozyme inhibitor [Thauera phenolivorans]|uniref:Lysozyme inhibitor n=1 Tax=Thauera phenolivorans TaxID=1792543 RepID=A0A7X7LX03_9RHOO|nr:MliC family protein [Thauera phenolivorans]NLF54635.1 lysozyme inhibitor [Thauera phenolivorans]
MIAKHIRLPALILLLAATTVANVTRAGDAGETTDYACAHGERFTVETRTGHLRLRDGSGVFALSSAPAERGERYTDGNTVFWDLGEEAILERRGRSAITGCKPRLVNL